MLGLIVASLLSASATDAEFLKVIQSEGVQVLADDFARCKGVWLASSGMLLATEQPANAKLMKERANGSEIASTWILAMRHNQQNPQDPKPLNSWNRYVDGLAETSATAAVAAVERGDSEQLGALVEKCSGMLELQQEFIDLMRRQSLTPP